MRISATCGAPPTDTLYAASSPKGVCDTPFSTLPTDAEVFPSVLR